MDTTLRQVGELLLGAIPTIIILLLLYAIYTLLVRKPLVRILEERRERTEGAVLKARADVAAAEAKTQDYEERLREARLVIYKAQEARRLKAQQARAEALAEARNRAQQQIREARAAIEQDMAAARSGLQAEVERLASEIIRTVSETGGCGFRDWRSTVTGTKPRRLFLSLLWICLVARHACRRRNRAASTSSSTPQSDQASTAAQQNPAPESEY